MAYSTTSLYPEDLNGTNAANLITGEVQTLQVPGPNDYYFIIPKAAPFFVDSLIVYNNTTGAKYVEGTDYLVGHRFVEAMDSIGRPIAGSIRFMKTSITGQVKLTYRTLGGNWGFSDTAILAELSNKQYNPLIRSWGDIDVLPYSFPVLEHDQSVDTLVGSEEINTTLDRIADILEAAAAGTSQSHITDYNNPHRTNATQVGLGNVPNYAMASNTDMTQATSSTLFTNPAGVKVAINLFAVTPLNAHINATGNVHDMVAADIGLGNVPNYKAATPAQAIDTTNTTTLLTPYTATLLIQSLSVDDDLTQLQTEFDAHLVALNPHNITPAIIGTYTSAQIDAKISAIGGGDASTFGGETPEQWEDKFPAVDDINTIMIETRTQIVTDTNTLNLIDVDDPTTTEEAAAAIARKLSWGEAGYNAYGMFNHNSEGRVISTTGTLLVSTDPRASLVDHWFSLKDAAYFIQADGSISAWGTAAVGIPTAWKTGSGFVAANAVDGLWAGLSSIYVRKASDATWYQITGSGTTPGPVFAGIDVAELYVNNGLLDTRTFGLYADQDDVYYPFGDSTWITAFNAIKSTYTTTGRTVDNLAMGSGYLTIVFDNNTIKVYTIGTGSSITLIDVTSTIDVKLHASNTTVKANTLTNVSAVSAPYDHTVLELIRAGEETFDMASFGTNDQGQLEVPANAGPFLSIMAGYKYTVTVDDNHYGQFYGNSPDNSLLYTYGSDIIVS